ncbi:MAG TPA: hypothetical protein VFQ93_10465 [Casimicrobiaceae bacterium]|nr:hypothetical protein [Casimicrobiaceae bacterium]
MDVSALRRALFVSGIAAFGIASTAHAALFRSYLRSDGGGTLCTLQAPCRLLDAALAAVQDGGEIWMLDSANFNTAPVSINKSVKIFAIPGALGSVVGINGDAIVINTAGDVTLRNLQILDFSGGVNGINVQNAAAVHVEKTSIDGFSTDASSCIHVDSSNTVRLYVDDSFLRHCRNGLFVNGANVANHTSVILDNTRIERGFNTASPATIGVWMTGSADVTLRGVVISRQDVAIRDENPLTSNTSHLVLDHSVVTRSNVGIVYANGVTSANGEIVIRNSQVLTNGDTVTLTNTAAGSNVYLKISDSDIGQTGGSGVTATNSAADTNSRIWISLERSQVRNVTGVGVALTATNGGKANLIAQDATISNATTAIATGGSGAGSIGVSLVRSTIFSTTTAISHGFGKVRLDGSHIVNNANSLVNAGSGNAVSLGNNMFEDNTDATGGVTYITPTIVPAK